ncbi:MAG: 7-carboxy-7-deazaguanine synthase QueE [Planctomycetes bacterium]|nr:7-carboxy-7-deazaguanine synthase QueE [Planctomycetota bacterium]
MTATLMINEVFHSIQGESTWSGLPCVFVRLMGCHLRCGYCDTEYAFHKGKRRTIDGLVAEVESHATPLVEVTGGEPLLQPDVHELMRRLCDAGKTVLLETSGACDISPCDPRVIRIMDLKTPGSGEAGRNLWSNLDHLTPRDEVKIVVCDRTDYEWAKDVITKHRLHERVRAVLLAAVAPVAPGLEIAGSPGLALRDLAEWVLADHLPVRMQTQLHKLIWDPLTRGV